MSEPTSPAVPTLRLPEFEPSADLWSRIERRHLQRQRQRRVRRSSAAIAAVLLLAVGVTNWWPQATVGDDALSLQRREALQLEQDWQALVRDDAANGYVQLHPVDHALQLAYDRHADSQELTHLWGERVRVLREMIQSRRSSSGPISI